MLCNVQSFAVENETPEQEVSWRRGRGQPGVTRWAKGHFSWPRMFTVSFKDSAYPGRESTAFLGMSSTSELGV